MLYCCRARHACGAPQALPHQLRLFPEGEDQREARLRAPPGSLSLHCCGRRARRRAVRSRLERVRVWCRGGVRGRGCGCGRGRGRRRGRERGRYATAGTVGLAGTAKQCHCGPINGLARRLRSRDVRARIDDHRLCGCVRIRVCALNPTRDGACAGAEPTPSGGLPTPCPAARAVPGELPSLPASRCPLYRCDRSHAHSPDAAPPPTQFALRGVLVHSGTANAGHYYSFIKPREADVNPGAGSGLRALCTQVSTREAENGGERRPLAASLQILTPTLFAIFLERPVTVRGRCAPDASACAGAACAPPLSPARARRACYRACAGT
jgi:hypothetical protein